MIRAKRALGNVVAYSRAYYQHILCGILIMLLVVIIYGHDLEILGSEALQSEALSHILLVPFLATILFYLKKDIVRASMALTKHKKKARYVDQIVGLSLCLIALLIYWYGSFTFYPLEYHVLSLPIFLMGVTLVLLNLKALVVLIFPLLFLLFLVPPPTDFVYMIGGTMANVNTRAAYTLLSAFGLPVTLSSAYGPPTIVLTSSMGQPASFTVDLPCSGIYSLIAFAMFAAFLLFIVSASRPRKMAIALLGFLIFDILNIVRITAVISIAYSFGEQVAMTMFHTFAGLVLVFVGMLLTLFIAEKALKTPIRFTAGDQPPCPKCAVTSGDFEDFCLNCGRLLRPLGKRVSRAAFAKIILLLLGFSILALSINAPTFVVAQGPVGIASPSSWQNATGVLPDDFQDYRLMFLYRDRHYEEIAHQDASLMYAYFAANGSQPTVYASINIANSISNLHNWEVCLITWQTAQGMSPLVNVLDSSDVQLLQDVPLIARNLVFEDHQYNRTQVTLYWYERVAFNTGVTVEQKYVRISLIILAQNSTGYENLKGQLATFGQSIAEYWEPLKYLSLISLGVPAQQSLLVISIAVAAFTEITQQSREWRTRNNNMRIFNNFATKEEKAALQMIKELAKQKKALSTTEIISALNKRSKKSSESSSQLDMLSRLEEYGFIRRDLASINGKPIQIWRI